VPRLKEAGLYGVFVSLDHADPGTPQGTVSGRDFRRGPRPGLCRKAGVLAGISAPPGKVNGGLDAMDVARDLNVLEVFLFDVIHRPPERPACC
jgi:hypothetical protein